MPAACTPLEATRRAERARSRRARGPGSGWVCGGRSGSRFSGVTLVTDALAAAGVLCAVIALAGPGKGRALVSMLLCAGAIAASVTMRGTPENEIALVNEHLRRELDQLMPGAPAPMLTHRPERIR